MLLPIAYFSIELLLLDLFWVLSSLLVLDCLFDMSDVAILEYASLVKNPVNFKFF